MPEFDKRIDAYIEKSRDFARPILEHLRKLVHKACPDVEETIKWGSPHFDYKGSLAGMASFKEHCAFGFWKHALLAGDGNLERTAMGSFGRITSLKDLPKDKEIVALIHQAMELNEKGIKVPKKPAVASGEVVVPKELTAALAKNKKAKASFDTGSPSHRREYVEWITEAKTEPTRDKRIATAIEWLSEGKSRNWKYERPKANKEK